MNHHNIKIFCISLRESTDRRVAMDTQFKQQGVDYQFIDAVVGSKESKFYDEKKRLKKYRSGLTRGEIGCFLSHRLTWEIFINSEANLCCILEDDAVLAPNFISTLKEMPKIKINWDLIRLYGTPWKNSKPSYGVIEEVFSNSHHVISYIKQPGCTLGYLINKNSAKKLIEYSNTFHRAVDDTIDAIWENDLKIFGIEPGIIHEADNNTSTIMGRIKKKTSLTHKITIECNRIPEMFIKKYFNIRRLLSHKFSNKKSNAHLK